MPCWVPYGRLDCRDCGGASVSVGEVGVSGAGIGGMLCRLSGDHRKTEQVTFPEAASGASSDTKLRWEETGKAWIRGGGSPKEGRDSDQETTWGECGHEEVPVLC